MSIRGEQPAIEVGARTDLHRLAARRVPSKTLPPLSSLDRMANGERLGQCETCGGHRWWDNRSRKATGEMSRSEPDYRCTDCGHSRWTDGRHQAGRRTTRPTPAASVTVVPAVPHHSGAGQPGSVCAALKRDGTPCRNGAMAGSPFCGPHSTAKARQRSRRPISAAAQPKPASHAGLVRCAGSSTARNTIHHHDEGAGHNIHHPRAPVARRSSVLPTCCSVLAESTSPPSVATFGAARGAFRANGATPVWSSLPRSSWAARSCWPSSSSRRPSSWPHSSWRPWERPWPPRAR